MDPERTRRRARPVAPSEPRDLRRRLVLLDQDQADLARARELLRLARAAEEPRDAFELAHRAALRGAGVLVTRANRARRRKLPLNVWTALERLGGPDAERAAQLAPLVAERMRLDRDPAARPDPELLRLHLEQTAQHLDQVAARLVEELPGRAALLTG